MILNRAELNKAKANITSRLANSFHKLSNSFQTWTYDVSTEKKSKRTQRGIFFIAYSVLRIFS